MWWLWFRSIIRCTLLWGFYTFLNRVHGANRYIVKRAVLIKKNCNTTAKRYINQLKLPFKWSASYGPIRKHTQMRIGSERSNEAWGHIHVWWQAIFSTPCQTRFQPLLSCIKFMSHVCRRHTYYLHETFVVSCGTRISKHVWGETFEAIYHCTWNILKLGNKVEWEGTCSSISMHLLCLHDLLYL